MKNRSRVVSAAPTSVTNITGFFTMWTGLSFLKLSPIAGMTISGSNNGRALADIIFLKFVFESISLYRSIGCRSVSTGLPPTTHLEMLDDRAHRQPGQEVQCPDDDDYGGDEQDKNVGPTTGKLPARCGAVFFWPGPRQARTGISSKYRPISMQNVCVQLNMVLA